MVAQHMPLGEDTVTLRCGEPWINEGKTNTACENDDEVKCRDREAGSEVTLTVVSFPFQEHGVGGVLWPAAVVLAHHLALRECPRLLQTAQEPIPTRTQSISHATPLVVELGCGSACLGAMAAAACGGARTLATDLPETVRLARRTLARNTLSVSARGGSVAVLPLPWGASLPPRLQQERPALILGADIIYRSELHDSLLDTLSALCRLRDSDESENNSSRSRNSSNRSSSDGHKSQEPTRVLLSFAMRHPDKEASFLEKAKSTHGFHWRVLDLESLPVNVWSKTNVRVIEFTAPLDE